MVEGGGDIGGTPAGESPGAAPRPARARKATFGDVLAELKRRRVFRMMVGYGIFAFAVLQISEPVMHDANLPEWVLTAILLALAAGFPVSLLLAWLFDLTAEGVKRTPSASGPVAVSVSRGRSRPSSSRWAPWRRCRESPGTCGGSPASGGTERQPRGRCHPSQCSPSPT